jgi:hypothetical protein
MNDNDRNFEINLAQIGMRYGASFALGVAIFAIGGTLMLTMDKEIIPEQTLIGIVFLLLGFIIATQSSFWKNKQISNLKKTYMTENENIPKTIFLYKDYLISLILCKRYNGSTEKSKQ